MSFWPRLSNLVLSKERMLQERIRIERYNTSIGVISTFVIALIAFYAYQPEHAWQEAAISLWLWVQIVIIVLWLLFVALYHQLSPWSTRLWPYLSTATSSLIGIMWGLGWMVFVTQENPSFDIIFSLLILSIFVGGVYATVFHLPSMILFVTGCLLPAMIHNFFLDAPYGDFFGVLFLLGMLAFLAFGVNMHRFLIRALEQREENVLLVKQLEQEKQQAIQANQEKTRFLAAASHDLRQPIQAIRMFEYLLSSQIEDQNQRDTLHKIETATESLASLLDSLLDVSKLDAGIIEAHPESFSLGSLLERLQQEYQQQAQEKEVELRVVMTECQVFSDPNQLERILRNLIQNAILHMERPGKLLIGARRQQDHLSIQVIDNGHGIPQSEQAKIFDEFYQINNPERNRAKGLGLGLSIVKRLSVLLGHELSFHSESNKGTHFCILIPISEEPSSIKTPHISLNRLPTELTRLLVVEDDIGVLEALQMLIETWGFDVYTAASQAEALEIAREFDIEIIVSDYQLQNDESGVDTVMTIRENSGKSIPAMILTGNTNPDILKELSEKSLPLLNKPVSPEKLKQQLIELTQQLPS